MSLTLSKASLQVRSPVVVVAVVAVLTGATVAATIKKWKNFHIRNVPPDFEREHRSPNQAGWKESLM